MAAAFRAGEIEDVIDHVHPEFRGAGLDRESLRGVLHRIFRAGLGIPYVALSTADEDEAGGKERTLVVLGLLTRGDPARARPRALRPFRIEARLVREDDKWLVVSADFER